MLRLNDGIISEDDVKQAAVLREVEDLFVQSQVGVTASMPQNAEQTFIIFDEHLASVTYSR